MLPRARRSLESRQARVAAEQATAARVAQSRRLQQVGGIVILAVALGAVAVAISIGPSGGGLATGRQARLLYNQVNSLIGGIPEHQTTLGDPAAKYTLTFFGDLECPICKAFSTGGSPLGGPTGGLPKFIENQVRSGNAKIVYRSLCTATCGNFSAGRRLFIEQQTAAYAAGTQDKFWYYTELFYRQQGAEGTSYMTPAFLGAIARQIPGLRFNAWTTARGDPSLVAQLQSDQKAAIALLPATDGSRATPGLVMSGPKGSRFIGEELVGYGQLTSAMRAVS
jgi:protein-disulfide isomerase